jgi:phosphoserine phosphatase RsbU/P
MKAAVSLKKLPLLFLLTMMGACGLLRAQNFDAANGNAPLLSLDGLWRFHVGDDPAWAQPGFDDSGWSLLRSDRDWNGQGYRGYSGMGWYRFHVTLPPGVTDAAISLPSILSCYEIYANGRRIGGVGKMPPNPTVEGTIADQMYAIPRDAISGRQVEITIRVWHWQGWERYYGGGPARGGGWIGDAGQVAQQNAFSRKQLHWTQLSYLILSLLQTLGALGALVLFFKRRQELEYLWFALILAFGAAAGWVWLRFSFTIMNTGLANMLEDHLMNACVPLAQLLFYARLLNARRSPFYWTSLICLIVSLLTPVFMNPGSNIEIYQYTVTVSALRIPSLLWILGLVFAKAWQNVPDARMLLMPALVQIAASLADGWVRTTYYLGWHRGDFAPILTERPFPIEATQAADFVFMLAVLGILILRFTRTRSQEESYAREFAAARDVQHYLIPENLPATPGLAIESQYLPAREVGGDFFQVLPDAKDGSVLVVVGDVAGKGLQAGMLATLIVGAIRVAASFTVDPGKILALLNERLQGRGLVTCLALRFELDGNATLANAGHLPPYLNGHEMAMEGALPLGAVDGMEFPVMKFRLSEGDSLVLTSDGIAEAQDADGQLFGFGRIGEMLREKATAAGLAAAAQSFGQEDDITVLTVTRMAAV